MFNHVSYEVQNKSIWLGILHIDLQKAVWFERDYNIRTLMTIENGLFLTAKKKMLMNEWMMHLYSALLCIVVHPKRFTIVWGGGSLLNHHQCAASTWMMRRLPQDNGASVLTTHQLQVERRESHRVNQVYALTTHQLHTGGSGERVIEPIKCMRSPHTSYRWRGERES